MELQRKASISFWLTIFMIYALGIYFQANFLLNTDISWLMLAVKRMLAGGTYVHDFFEPNPPMALYIYIPAVLIAKAVSLSTLWSLSLSVYLAASFSLYLCAMLLKKIFSAQDFIFNRVFLSVIAAVFLLFPGSGLGQKENFLIILTLPYFLLIVSVIQHQALAKHLKVVIGLLAGIGFTIKPFFLLSFLFVEIYFCWTKKNINAWGRPECFSVLFVLLIYLLLVPLLHYDYLSIVIPYSAPAYYLKFNYPLLGMLKSNATIYLVYVLLFFIITYKRNQYKLLSTILLLATIGFLFAFILQRANWYYRILPLLSTSSLLCFLLFKSLLTQEKFDKREYILVGFFTISLAAFLIVKVTSIWLSILFYPYAYFIFFGILFYSMLLIADSQKRYVANLVKSSLIMVVGFWVYKLGQHPAWYPHLFLLTTLGCFLTYVVFIPQQKIALKLRHVFLTFVALALFAYQFFLIATMYDINLNQRSAYKNFYTLMSKFANKSVYFFSTAAYPFLVLDDYNLKYASRFPTMNYQPFLDFNESDSVYRQAYAEHQSEMNFFISAMIQDINSNQPDFVFVDTRTYNIVNHAVKESAHGLIEQPDYIRLFSLNPLFKNMWAKYSYVETAEDKGIYKFRIYRRLG